jgi:hypothetical protein
VDQKAKQAVRTTRLSCHRFRSNEARLRLSLIACSLGNLWRRLVLPKKIEKWSLTSLQQWLVKTGGRLVKHAWYRWLMLARSHLTRRLFGSMVRRTDALAVATEQQEGGDTSEIRRPRRGRSEKCLWNALKIWSFLALRFCGRRKLRLGET